MREARAILFIVVGVILNGVVVFTIFTEVSSQEPVTRWSVFVIVLNSLALFNTAVLLMIGQVMKLMDKQVELLSHTLDAVGVLAGMKSN
jgi:hypothetical protein